MLHVMTYFFSKPSKSNVVHMRTRLWIQLILLTSSSHNKGICGLDKGTWSCDTTAWMPREGKNEKLWTILSSAAAESTVHPTETGIETERESYQEERELCSLWQL